MGIQFPKLCTSLLAVTRKTEYRIEISLFVEFFEA